MRLVPSRLGDAETRRRARHGPAAHVRASAGLIGRALVLALVALALTQATALAAVVTPTRLDDPAGPGSCPSNCSLRQAIEAAGPGGTVSLKPPAPSGTYKLTSRIMLASDVTIEGPGASATSISGGGAVQLFYVSPGVHLAISGVGLIQGLASGSGSSGGSGGAIQNFGDTTLSGVNLEHDIAAGGTPTEIAFGGGGGDGGAIYNVGVLSINGGLLTEDAAQGGSSKFGKATTEFPGEPGSGGAIDNFGSLAVTGATFVSNTAEAGSSGTIFPSDGGAGGAIYSDGTVRINASSFTGNATAPGEDSGGEGGAITSFASLRVAQSAFSGNLAKGTGSASGEGGALDLHGTTQLIQSSLTGNSANGPSSTGGAVASVASLSVTGSTITGNAAADGAAFTSRTALTIAGSSITGNVAAERGGGIEAFGLLAVSATTLSGNSAKEAGAINNDGGATITESTLANNSSKERGGAIVNNSGMTVASSTLSGNTAKEAGALMSNGATTVAGSTLVSNSAKENGGAIVNGGGLTITSSTLAGNNAENGSGGAIRNFASASVVSSTISGNSAKQGGGVESSASLEVTNSTIADNIAAEQGGGMRVFGSTEVVNATIAANTAAATKGGNIASFSSSLTLHDSIIALGKVTGGTGGENCYSPVATVSLGYNLEDRNQCSLTGPGDLKEVANPLLGPLAANGGPTQTIALEPGSPAIDAGDPAGCTNPAGELLGTDQRGVARTLGARCDIGAYEFVPPPPPPPAAPVATPIVAAAPTPAISGLKVSPSPFRAASSGATISVVSLPAATASAAKKAPIGTKITYSDTLAATTTFVVLRSAAGVRSGKRCVAPPRKRKGHAKPKACTRLLEVASFSHLDKAGANSLRFSGRVHARKLAAGRYTLRATPVLAARRGATASTSFAISG